MAARLFTVEEVDRMIPALERIFSRMLQLRVALRQLEGNIDPGADPAGVDPAGPRLVRTRAPTRESDRTGQRAKPLGVRQRRALLRGLWETLGEAIAEVRELGGEVKDVEAGLVDFRGQRGDEEVFLCWMFGERSVEHWHALNDGFRGRQPLDDQFARTPRGLD
jgi:hypothetical protein